MKNIYEYINENFINEWKQDLMPQCVIIMGGPGAGKTWWMHNQAHEFFKKHNRANINLSFKELDSDNNLRKYQLLHIDEFVEGIIHYCEGNAIHDNITSQRAAFNEYIKTQQKEMDEKCKAGGSPNIDLSVIDWKFCQNFIKRYDKAKGKSINPQKILDEFKTEFKKKYFNELFASDFSVRSMSKSEYKKDFNNKLNGKVEDLEFVGPSDVIIAITGDKLEKIKQVTDICNNTHAITVVYLNVPEELSIKQDAQRERSVGPQMIHDKLIDIHKTWEDLINKEIYKDLGIYKVIEMKDKDNGKGEFPKWTVAAEYLNTDLIKSQY